MDGIAARTRTLTLRDGRCLAYAQWGPDEGDPVVYLHGALGSRLERHREDEDYRRLGVRLITVDRPGHGLSSSHEDGTLQDFADDLEELLDHLGLLYAGVLGHGTGGLNVLAFAHRHPARVRVAGVVSGVGMIERPGGMEGLGKRVKRIYRNARSNPRRAGAEMRINVLAFRYRPSLAFRGIGNPTVTSNPEFQRRFREALLEGARAGTGGFVSDIAISAGRWGFDPAEIPTPIYWWHGSDDAVSPLSHAQYVIDQVPDAGLTVIDGGGHFMIHEEIESILSSLSPRTLVN